MLLSANPTVRAADTTVLPCAVCINTMFSSFKERYCQSIVYQKESTFSRYGVSVILFSPPTCFPSLSPSLSSLYFCICTEDVQTPECICRGQRLTSGGFYHFTCFFFLFLDSLSQSPELSNRDSPVFISSYWDCKTMPPCLVFDVELEIQTQATVFPRQVLYLLSRLLHGLCQSLLMSEILDTRTVSLARLSKMPFLKQHIMVIQQ